MKKINIIQEIHDMNAMYLDFNKAMKDKEYTEQDKNIVKKMRIALDLYKIIKTMLMEEATKNKKMIDQLIREGKLTTHREVVNNNGSNAHIDVIDQTMDQRIMAIPEDIVLGIIEKMVKSHKQNIELLEKTNKTEDLEKEKYELELLNEFLPQEATQEDVEKYLNETYPDGISQKEMGLTIKNAKEKFSRVDGKMLSECVRKIIKK